MTDQPTPDNPFPIPPGGVPDSAGLAAGAPQAPLEDVLDSGSAPAGQPGRGKRGLLIGGAVAAVAVVGAGAFAVTSFLSSGADVAEAMPADTLGFVSVNLDPGGKQQVEAFKTMRKFPGLKDALNEGLGDDLRAQLFDYLNTQGECDLDYKADLAPWLGTTAAVGALDGGDADPVPFFVLQVTDEEKAPAGLKKLAACGDTDPSEENWVIADGWATLAETKDDAKKVATATQSGTLADNTAYKKWTGELGDQGVLNYYVAADALRVLAELSEESGISNSQMDGFQGLAGTLRFADGGLELNNVGGSDQPENLSDQAGAAVETLPADTLLAFSVSAKPELIDAYSELADSQDLDMAEIGEALGISFPDDMAALFGESMTLSVGGNLDIDELANAGDPAFLPVAVSIRGDAEEAESVLAKLILAHRELRPYLTWDKSDDRLVVGPNTDYRKQVLENGELKADPGFTSVVPHAEDAGLVFFLNFNGADDWLYSLTKDADPTVAENVKPLAGLGMSVWVEGDAEHVLLKLTTD